MAALDKTTLREHLRRRAGGTPDGATINRVVTAIHRDLTAATQPPETRRSLRDALPWPSRLGLAVAFVAAISLIAVPLVGGPRNSLPPSGATPPPVAAPTPDPAVLQVLSLEELRRVVALGDTDPYRDHIVVADVNLVGGGPHQLTCVAEDCPNGLLVEGAPELRVIQPFEDADILRGDIGDNDLTGPVLLRIRRSNAVELIGAPPMAAGQVAWPLPSFVTTVDRFLRTMDLNPSKFIVGGPYVVDAQLVGGPAVPCPAVPLASPARLNEFACGVTTWLAPAEMPDPSTIIDSNRGHPVDWVRVQNGIYQRYRPDPDGPDATATTGPRRGFYLVFPLVRYDTRVCFQCDAGAVAILYAKLEAVPIP